MKLFRSLLVAFPALLIATLAGAQTGYPDKPVRIFVGFTAGSATDITARAFAQKFNEAWNVPVTVENVPGAAGSVAADRVSKSAPDGYTLYWGANGALTINPSLQVGSAFDPARDLAPIARLLVMPSILAVNNDVPAKSVQELIALAKAQPGKLSYASPGVGTPQHIGGELFKALAGVDIVHVPYRGAIFIDVIGGRVSMTWQNIGAILPTVRGGQLRGIAVTSLKRSPNTPDLPTIANPEFRASSPSPGSASWRRPERPRRSSASSTRRHRRSRRSQSCAKGSRSSASTASAIRPTSSPPSSSPTPPSGRRSSGMPE